MIDSHCHLAGAEFAGDLDEVAARARAAGVAGALCILEAGDAAESDRARAVRLAWPGVRFSTGIHPHHAGAYDAELDRAVQVVRDSVARQQACAVGEIGLDYHYDLSPRGVQQAVFEAQVATACDMDLPVVIHTRDATDDTLRILRDAGKHGVRGVFHCFTGDEVMARRALDLGFHLSFAGIVTFPRSAGIREAARLTPADRLLVETDSPYLAPVPFRGRRNEPMHVAEVYRMLAGIRGDPIEALAAQVAASFEALFGSASPPARVS